MKYSAAENGEDDAKANPLEHLDSGTAFFGKTVGIGSIEAVEYIL